MLPTSPCLVTTCDPALGVITKPKPSGADCSDGNICNGSETCSAVGTCEPGIAVSIDDSDICTADTCDPIAGVVHAPLANCNATPGQGDGPFETRASLMGRLVLGGAAVTGATFKVTDAPLLSAMPAPAPRTDVVPQVAGDGSFRLRLATFPDVEADRTPPKHVILRIDVPGALPAYRDAWLHTGDAVDLGVIRLVARDPAVTVIGPAGGVARDSQDRVEVVVPAGAVSTPVPIRITPIVQRDEMPFPLPDSTPTLYGVDLEPDGQTFAVPVTVRLRNWRDAPTTLAIPTGVFDAVNGRWEHEAQAVWDGNRFAFSTSTFSLRDCNLSRPNVPNPRPDDGDGDGPDDSCKPGGSPHSPDKSAGSTASVRGGSVRNTISLPSYLVRNENFGMSLAYDSGLAASRKLGTAPSDYGAVPRSTFSVPLRGIRFRAACVPSAASPSAAGTAQVGRCQPQMPAGTLCSLGQTVPVPLTISWSVAGSSGSSTVSMAVVNGEVDFAGYVNLPLVGADIPSPGLYPARIVLRAQTPGSCVAPSPTFGVSDEAATGVQSALEDGPLATIDTHLFVPHRLTSPYGAGWGVTGMSRVYREGDVAHLFSGEGRVELFRPRAFGKNMMPPGSSDVDALVLARDARTGEIFSAGSFILRRDVPIDRVDPTTGARTPILTGLTSVEPSESLAIAYVGNQRRFVIARDDSLIEVDSAGITRLLATRSGGETFSPPQVAASGEWVYYTDAITPAIYRLRLTDPAPAPVAISQMSGGDARLFPRVPLSGVTFADPRGLAFGPDGVLYVADRRRNTVFAIHPDATGVVGPDSRVDLAVGDGTSVVVTPIGERMPGERLPIREPLGLSVANDGTLHVMTTYGVAAWDPVAREAEWLFMFGGVDELTINPTRLRLSLVSLTRTALLTRGDDGPGGGPLLRFDVDVMSSQFDPTRTMRVLANGEMELTDTARASIERFDVAGRLVERRHRTGERVLSVVYADARSERIDRLTDGAGGVTGFAYDAAGKLRQITDARGRISSFAVDSAGDLVSVTNPGGERQQFVYAEHRIQEKRSPRGDLTRYAYRADGTVESVTRPEGAKTLIDPALAHPSTPNAQGRLEQVGRYTDARGVLHEVVQDRRGQIIKDTYVADGVTRVEEAIYDGTLFDRRRLRPAGTAGPSDFNATGRSNRALLRISHRLVNGVAIGPRTIFDGHGRPVKERKINEPDTVRQWLYDDQNWLLEETEGPSLVSQQYQRDAAGHVMKIFDAAAIFDVQPGAVRITGREETSTWRPDGLLETRTTHGVTRKPTYDASLNEVSWTDTLGRSMAFERDLAGNITRSFDGVATTFTTWDSNNRLLETRDALGNKTIYGYAHAGCGCSQEDLVTSIHTPDLPAGVNWQVTYDADGRLASVIDPHGFAEQYAYEPTGEIKRVTDKLGRQTTWTHDQLGRVKAMVDPLGRRHENSYAVPKAGAAGAAGTWVGPTLMAASADASAAAAGLMAALRDGDYQIGRNAYPAHGYPAQISLYRDATFALAFSHFYDVARRQTLRIDRTRLPFDSVALAQSDPRDFWDETTGYHVDTSRPIQASFATKEPPTPAVPSTAWQPHDFEFDVESSTGLGISRSVKETWTRDTGGRPTVLSRQFFGEPNGNNPPPQNSTYAYRPDGRLSRVTNPDGVHIDFTYDPRGLVATQIVSGEGTYSYGYDGMGRNNLLTYPDGHLRRQLYDALGRITSRCYEYPGPTMRCYTAQYDAVGNPVGMTDPDGEDVIAYDALDRLTKVTRKVGGVEVGVEDYAFNALGALKINAGVPLDHRRPRLDGTGLADSAVPASVGGQPVVLDGGGRVTSLRGASLRWLSNGALREVQELAPAPPITYGFDSNGRRAMQLSAAQKEFYVYEGLDRIATIDQTGVVKETYLFDGIDHPLRIKQGATTAYYELDLAGNVRGLHASGGASLGRYRYSAFGKTVDDTTTIAQPLRWKGRWFSPVAGGTYDVRARQWSPEMGVFLTIDEYQYHDSESTLWGWPNQNPVGHADPSGQQRVGPKFPPPLPSSPLKMCRVSPTEPVWIPPDIGGVACLTLCMLASNPHFGVGKTVLFSFLSSDCNCSVSPYLGGWEDLYEPCPPGPLTCEEPNYTPVGPNHSGE